MAYLTASFEFYFACLKLVIMVAALILAAIMIYRNPPWRSKWK